jgi:hypothetical protein
MAAVSGLAAGTAPAGIRSGRDALGAPPAGPGAPIPPAG